nr:hypothetical protein [Microbispora sp. GKU 823]
MRRSAAPAAAFDRPEDRAAEPVLAWCSPFVSCFDPLYRASAPDDSLPVAFCADPSPLASEAAPSLAAAAPSCNRSAPSAAWAVLSCSSPKDRKIWSR